MRNFLLPFIFVLSSCSFINEKLGLKDDNIFEESFEYAIKYQTGIDVDLTPISQE
jgi:hypothetical protein